MILLLCESKNKRLRETRFITVRRGHRVMETKLDLRKQDKKSSKKCPLQGRKTTTM